MHPTIKTNDKIFSIAERNKLTHPTIKIGLPLHKNIHQVSTVVFETSFSHCEHCTVHRVEAASVSLVCTEDPILIAYKTGKQKKNMFKTKVKFEKKYVKLCTCTPLV